MASKRAPPAPTRVSESVKRRKTTPITLSLDDEDAWLDAPVPTSNFSIPICCANQTCKKHTLSLKLARDAVTTGCSLLCEETLSSSEETPLEEEGASEKA